jgi:hypothetical protein
MLSAFLLPPSCSIVLGCKSVYAAWRLRVGQGVVSKLQLGSAQSVVELSHVELQVGGGAVCECTATNMVLCSATNNVMAGGGNGLPD